METLIQVLAITSLMTSLLPMLVMVARFIIYLNKYKYGTTLSIGYGAFVWFAMFVWPIAYWIVK